MVNVPYRSFIIIHQRGEFSFFFFFFFISQFLWCIHFKIFKTNQNGFWWQKKNKQTNIWCYCDGFKTDLHTASTQKSICAARCSHYLCAHQTDKRNDAECINQNTYTHKKNIHTLKTKSDCDKMHWNKRKQKTHSHTNQ